MPRIECAGFDCIHNFNGWCDVGEPGFVEMVVRIRDGKTEMECLDYAPVTDDEYEMIVGRKRELTDVAINQKRMDSSTEGEEQSQS